MAKRRPRRSFVGLVPQLSRWLGVSARWLIRHPQPLVTFGLMAGAIWALWGYARQADVFRISQVLQPAQATFTLRQPLTGQNLWQVDIRRLADDLQQQQPWLKAVRVVRQVPDTIRIEAIQRVPVAQVRLHQWYRVDGEGFLLPQAGASPSNELPRVVGLERTTPPLKVGAANDDEQLATALRVLSVLRRSPALVSRRVAELDVGDLRHIRFSVTSAAFGARRMAAPLGAGGTQDAVEIHCGSERELAAQLERLRAALKVLARQPMAVRYIDVRFAEPVISPRT